MGRKKKKSVQIQKPFCYYCDRTFDDEGVLTQHQRSRHFKCVHRGCKKLGSAHALMVHVTQVHKETLDLVPNSLPGRGSPDLNIYGMQGVPQEILDAKFRDEFGDPLSKRLCDESIGDSVVVSSTMDYALPTITPPPSIPTPPTPPTPSHIPGSTPCPLLPNPYSTMPKPIVSPTPGRSIPPFYRVSSPIPPPFSLGHSPDLSSPPINVHTTHASTLAPPTNDSSPSAAAAAAAATTGMIYTDEYESMEEKRARYYLELLVQ